METRIFVDQDGLIVGQIRFQQWEAVMVPDFQPRIRDKYEF